MMCPDHGAVDHVCGGVALYQFGQRFEHRVEHAGRDPAPVSAENAVPLAIFIRQMTLLRTRAGNPHHTFEIQPVVLRRAATATTLRRQQRADDRPFVVRQTNPLAQRCLQKSALNQSASPLSTFVRLVFVSSNFKASLAQPYSQCASALRPLSNLPW